MLQEKLHNVAVSNMDVEVKVRWLELWNGNRFDKDALHFSKSSLSDSALDNWLFEVYILGTVGSKNK